MTGPARLDVRPRPGAAAAWRRVSAHARLELELTVRNGEQLLVTLVIPLGVLFGLGLSHVVDLGTGSSQAARWSALVPGVLALAVLSTSFTGLAIQTGFERRSGALKRLGATPLGQVGLLAGKGVSVVLVETAQVALVVAVGLALGWQPHAGWSGTIAALALLLLGTWALCALGLLLAGTVRAEATLATANLLFVVLLVGGGLFTAAAQGSGVWQRVREVLPTAALADGLRAALGGAAVPFGAWVVLVLWGAGATAAAARWFRWE